MPDVELRPQVYKDPRPKEAFDRYHAIVRDHEPEAKVYEPVRVGTVVWALLAHRARGYGSERVPNGSVILAPNHASFMDHFFTGAFVRRRVQFMGKSQLFKGIGAWVVQPRRSVPGAPRLPRRGDLHDLIPDPGSRWRDRHVLRGRPLA